MFQQIKLLESLETEYEKQLCLVRRLEERLQELPSGSLVCKKGNYYRVISQRGKSLQYPISQNWNGSKFLIDELKEYQHIKRALPLLKNNIHCYEQVLKKLTVYDYAQIHALLSSIYQDLIPSSIIPDGDLLPSVWQEADYRSNSAFPEDLIYQSEGGLLTRSKAEAEIATKLEQSNLAFRYEPELILGEKIVYPDFCVLRLRDRRLLYWEHFGKMDDPDYSHKTMKKLKRYGDHGYRLGENLLMTWESKLFPLKFKHINACIAENLL